MAHQKSAATVEQKPGYERQSAVLETITDGSFRLDGQGIILYASPVAAQKIFDRPLDDLAGKNFWQEFPRFSGSVFESQVRQALSTHKVVHFEARLPVGGKWYDVYAFPQAGQVDLYLKDITHQKRFQLRSFHQEALLKAIFETDPSGLAVVTGTDFRLAYANRAFLSLFPVGGTDPMGKPLLSLIPVEMQQALDIDSLVKTLSEKHYVSIPRVIMPANGNPNRYFIVQLRSLDWEDGPAVLIVIWETTEHEQALKDLHDARQRIGDILESIIDGVMGIDRNWNFTYLNQRAAQNGSVPPEQLIGKNIWETYPALLGTELETAYRKAMDQRQFVHFEMQGLFSKSVYGIRIYPSSDGITVYWVDISEQKHTENTLRESEERFRLAAEAMNEGLWELNFQTNQSWWNEAYDRLFGPRPIQAAEDKYDWWLDHIHPDDREHAKKSFWEAVEGNTDRWECEYRFRRPDGATAYVLDRAVIARDAAGKPVHMTGAMLDLSSLRHAEEEREQLLRELEAERSLWKATVSSMVDAVTICDAEGNAYYMNEAYSHLVEKTIIPGLSLGDHPQAYQIYHPDGTLFEPSDLPLQKAALSGEILRGVELVQKTASGEDLLLTWNASPIRDNQGKVIGAVAVGHDITLQRQMENALRESEEKFRLIADTLPGIVWTADTNGTIDYLNRAGMELLSEASGKPVQDAIVATLEPSERQAVSQEWQASVEAGEPFEIEFRLETPGGGRRWFLGRSVPVRNNQGATVKWYGTATDIQDLKQAQQELERRVQARTQELHVANQELRLSAGRSLALSEISRQMSLAGVDYQSVVDAVVKTTSRLIGDACVLRLLSEDGQWLNPVSFFHKNAEALAVLAESLKPNLYSPEEGMQGEVIRLGKGKIFTVSRAEEWLAFAGGDILAYMRRFNPSSALIVPLRMRDKVVGTLTVTREHSSKIYTQEDQILLQDLADRAALAIYNSMLYRDLEKSLLQEKLMRQQLIQSEKYAALARLVASVAHELNNPIQTIQNSIYLIRGEITDGPAQEFMAMAIEETRRIARLTEQLRETYRPSKDASFKSFNLVQVVKDVHRLLEAHFQHHQVIWELGPSPDPIVVYGIPDQLKQVFINICINAIDAIGENSGRLEVDLTLYPEKQRVCVSFKDSGPGIPPENLGKLFEPFFTTKPKGTGLGLAISREIVEGHGGEITVDSRQGKGAIFRIWLPVMES